MQFGKFQGRIEDTRLVSGQGCYVDDMHLDGMVHGFVLRAQMPGDIVGIDAAEARKAPGVLAVYTAADLARMGAPTHFPSGVSLPNTRGEPAFQSLRPILAVERARFTGEGLAFVVAKTREAARDAAELIEVDMDGIDAVVTSRAARAEGAPAVWDEVPDNVAFVWEKGDMEMARRAMDAAPHKVRLESHVPRLAVTSMEPRGAIGQFSGGRLVLHSSTQHPYAMKNALAPLFDVDPDQVRVIARDVGGSFGMKIGAYPEDALCLIAAQALERPVKWISDRSEAFLTDNHGRDTTIEASLGFDDDGNLLALIAHFDMNVGAYASARSQAAGLGNLPGISGVYRLGPTAATAYGVFTNVSTLGPYRGAGRPEATYTIERLIDMAAAELGVDPFELRRKNLVPAEAMPYKTGFVFEYDCGEFIGNMNKAEEVSDRKGFPARKAESKRHCKLRGIGYSNPIEVAGGPATKPGPDQSRVSVGADGTVTVHAGVMSVGQGLLTVFSEMIAERLGTTRDKIRYVQGDTDDLPGGRGSGGSSSAPVGSGALTLAVDGVLEKGAEIAAEMLEAAAADIEFSDGAYRIAGTDRAVTLTQVAAESEKHGNPLTFQSFFQPPAVTYPNGCHVCEVEVDPETGKVEICRYTVVEDVGRVLNPTLLLGQMHGGVYQGAGQTLMERLVYDETGQPLTGSFMDYAMPRADMMPELSLATREVPTAANPLGVKGVGEAGTVGSLVCVVNALCDALGVTHFEMPATPDRVWAALSARSS